MLYNPSSWYKARWWLCLFSPLILRVMKVNGSYSQANKSTLQSTKTNVLGPGQQKRGRKSSEMSLEAHAWISCLQIQLRFSIFSWPHPKTNGLEAKMQDLGNCGARRPVLVYCKVHRRSKVLSEWVESSPIRSCVLLCFSHSSRPTQTKPWEATYFRTGIAC